MPESVFDSWRAFSRIASQAPVVPDGCRDVIFKAPDSGAPGWVISPLFDRTRAVDVAANQEMIGYRLRPGAWIDESELLRRLHKCRPDSAAALMIIEQHTGIDPLIEQVLTLAVVPGVTVAGIGRELGVSTRTLERKVLTGTGRSPVYWLRLARARRAAGQLIAGELAIEAAASAGYSDQAHFTRECRHWFGLPPRRLLANKALTGALAQGDCDPLTGEQISIKKPSRSLT